MPALMGLVYYTDDPHKRVFRRVYPQPGDPANILDDPRWITEALPARAAVLDKVTSDAGRKRGSPRTPATEPVVYFVNATATLAALTPAQQATYDSWLAAGPTWMNFIDLGTGTASALVAAADVISPSWIVVVGGQNPGKGALTRQATIRNTNFSLWTV